MTEKFTLKNIFTTEDRTKVINSVHKLREHWINRGGYFEYPFFSLGAASYMDASEDQERYYKWANKFNPILDKEFDWLYAKVAQELESILGKPVIYDEKQALPGFHIFLADELFEIPIASRHVDLQYRDLEWGDLQYDPNNSISFTAYLQLPSAGGGIYSWDYTYDDLKDLSPEERNDKLAAETPNYHQFQEGDFIVHSGLHYHQIAAMTEVQETDARISLQGHGILDSQGKYHLYW